MRLISIELQNFISFDNLFYEFTPQGLCSLDGPPGVGKSSFLDGVSWVLFGSISKNVGVEEIINRKVGRNLFGKLRFEYMDQEYAVVRCRKHNQYGNDVWIEGPQGQIRGKDARETDKLILQTFSLSYDIFQKATYFSQFSKIDAFLSSSDTAKKELISDIANLQKYDTILEKAKLALNRLEKDLNSLDSNITVADAEARQINIMIEDTKKRSQEWESGKRARVATLKSQSENFEAVKHGKLASLKQSFDQHETSRSNLIATLSAEKERFESERLINIASCEQAITQLKNQIQKHQSEMHQFAQEPAVNYDEKRKAINDKLLMIRTLETKRNEYLGGIQFHERSLQHKKNKANVELQKIADGAPSNCSFCHNAISPELIISQVESIKKTFEEDNVAIEQLKKNVEAIDQGLQQKSALDAELIKINNEESSHKMLVAKNDQLRSFISNAQGNITAKEKEIEYHRTCQNPHDSRIEVARTQANPFQREIDLEQAKTNPYSGQLSQVEAEANPYSNQFAEVEVRRDQALKKSEAMKSERVGLHKRYTYAKWWKEAFGVYIRSYLMDSFIEQINQKSNEYLDTLFDGGLQMDISSVTEAGKDLKEKISIKIFNGGEECSYDSLSGGERCRICLSVNLAISDLARSMSQSNFNILMIDEAFNGLNEEGKNQTMKLLKELELKFDTIFVIDHTEAFKSMFTNRILVEKVGGYSRLVQ